MCASTRVNFWLRSVHPDLTEAFALQHDANIWTCLDTIFGSPFSSRHGQDLCQFEFVGGMIGVEQRPQESGKCPLGQLGRLFAHGARPTPDIAETMIAQLEVGTVTCFEGVQRCRRLVEDAGLEVPSWRELAETPAARVEDPEPGQPKHGWQQKATRMVEQSFVHTRVWPRLNGPARALLRSQHGPSLLHRSRLSRRPGSPGSTRSRSTSCFAAASTCPSPSPCAPANVAANWTCLATIAQRVQRQGCWERGGSLWSVRPRRFVGKQEHEWPRMCGSETWTSESSTL